jgi:hypothetical protein
MKNFCKQCLAHETKRKIFIILLWIIIIFSPQRAETAQPPMPAYEVPKIIEYLLYARPEALIQDVITELGGQPESIEGNSYQWHLVTTEKDGKLILRDGTSILEAIVDQNKVLYSTFIEIWSTEQQALARENDLIMQIAEFYGDASKFDSAASYWFFPKDNLGLVIRITPQNNGKYFVTISLNKLLR